jgi:hypothetical protein
MHALLLAPTRHKANATPIAFAWWPRPTQWDPIRVVERACRAIPACRPELDFIALPDVEAVRDMVASSLHDDDDADDDAVPRLRPWQVLWYTPRLGDTDAPLRALDDILVQLRQRMVPTCALGVYVSFIDQSIRDRIVRAGFDVVGDADMHPMVGSLACVKAWLHPTLAVDARGDVVVGATPAARAIETSGCRIPHGYVCGASVADRVEAHRRVTTSHARAVMKPVHGMGCQGLVLDARSHDVASEDIDCSVIIEAFIPSRYDSPAVYMCGDKVLAIVDQVIIDGRNTGNAYPSIQAADVQERMINACRSIHAAFGVHGQWGADFVIDTDRVPVIVDLNMGRPLGSLGYLIWRSMQPAPRIVSSTTRLRMLVCERMPPVDQTLQDLRALLRAEGLLWSCPEGVVVVQHLPGHWSAILCASWQGRKALHTLYARLRAVDHASTYRTRF